MIFFIQSHRISIQVINIECMTVFMLQGNQLIVTDLLALKLISASIYFFMFAFTPDEEQLWQ